MADDKQIRVGLSEKDSENLREIADKLGIPELEVIRKGLELLTLYAKTQNP
jgi:hypothetical protein